MAVLAAHPVGDLLQSGQNRTELVAAVCPYPWAIPAAYVSRASAYGVRPPEDLDRRLLALLLTEFLLLEDQPVELLDP